MASTTTSQDTSQETVLLLTQSRNSITRRATMKFDATLEETHTETDTVTDHPVEEGENIADHVRPEPSQVTAHIVVSNSAPFEDGDTQGNVTESVNGQSFTFKSAAKDGSDDTRGSLAWAQINGYRGQLLTLATSLRRYTSMVITSLTSPRSSMNSDGVEFTATFKHIVVVKNKTTTAKVSKDKNVVKKQKAGTKSPEEDVHRSTLKKLVNVGKEMIGSPNGTVSGTGSAVEAAQ